MTLMECPECKQQISSFAYFCPKCGNPKKRIRLVKSEKTYQLLFIMTTLAAGVFYLLNVSSKSVSQKEIFLNCTYLFIGISVACLVVSWITSSYELKSN